jgi:hypothetical protein
MPSPWTRNDPIWNNMTDHQKAAAMALMEAGKSKVGDAMNAASAMVNRAGKSGEPLGAHVSRSIYQPTIEPSQQARLPGIVKSPEYSQLTDYVAMRQSGEIADPTGGATHFLAKPNVMLGLEAQNPSKYKNWGPRGANWTGYDSSTGQYSNQTFEDSSHAFLAPEGRADGAPADPNGSMMAERMKTRLAQTQGAYDDQGNPVDVASGQTMPTERTAQAGTGKASDAAPGRPTPDNIPLPPDGTKAALAQAMMQQAAGSQSRNGWEALGNIAKYGAGMYTTSQAADENRAWKTKLRDAMAAAVNSGDRTALLNVMAQNPETANAAASAMLAATGPKAQDWQVMPAQTDSYGRPMPARMFNKHTGEVREAPTVSGQQTVAPTPAQGPAQALAMPEQPTTSSQAPASSPPQPGMQYGMPVPKAPEGYVHRQDANGFQYRDGQPVFVPKAELDTEAKKRETNQDQIRTNAQGADAFLRGLGRLQERTDTAPEGTFGPISASETNQTLNRMFGTNADRQQSRDMVGQSLKDLELSVAQMRMKGQGAITESERAIARGTLPSLDKPIETQKAILKGLEDEAVQRLRDARAIGMELPKAASDHLDRVDAAERQKAMAAQPAGVPAPVPAPHAGPRAAPATPQAATPARRTPGDLTDDELKRALGF